MLTDLFEVAVVAAAFLAALCVAVGVETVGDVVERWWAKRRGRGDDTGRAG